MEPELDALDQQFGVIQRDADQLVAGLSELQLTWRPRPGAWSIADCLAHLVTVHSKEIATLRHAVMEGRAKGRIGRGPFKYSVISRWFVKSMEPPVKTKFKVPKVYVPPPNPDPRTAIEDFRKTLVEMKQLLRDADTLDLAKIKVPSAVTKLLRMNLGARLALFAAHDRRHLWQSRNVTKTPGFPK
jgi:hypothetical protein